MHVRHARYVLTALYLPIQIGDEQNPCKNMVLISCTSDFTVKGRERLAVLETLQQAKERK